MLNQKNGITKINTEVAIKRLIKEIEMPKISFILFHVSPVFDFEQVKRLFCEAYPSTVVVGSITQGQITGAGYVEDCLVAMSVYGDDFKVDVAVVENFKEDGLLGNKIIEQSVKRLGLNIKDERLNDKMFGVAYIDGLVGAEEKLGILLNLMFKKPLNLVGGSCGNLTGNKSAMSVGADTYQDAVILVFVKTNKKVYTGSEVIHQPMEKAYCVTDVDMETRVLKELDNRPVTDVYKEALGLTKAELTPSVFAKHPMGKMSKGDTFIASPYQVLGNNHIQIYIRLVVGNIVHIMEPMNAVEVSKQTAKKIQENIAKPKVMFGVSCILRYLQFLEDGQTTRMTEAINDVVPMFGFTSLGEIIGKTPINQTLTYLVIGE